MGLRIANWFRAQSLDIVLGFAIYLTPWINPLAILFSTVLTAWVANTTDGDKRFFFFLLI